jgi:hypothetical protein
MGRHSAVDDDDEQVVTSAAVEAEAVAARQGRHARGEDTEDTGPVAGSQVRELEGRAAAQDDQPTERIGLADLLMGDEEPGPADAGADPEPGPGPAVDTDPAPTAALPAAAAASAPAAAAPPAARAPAKPGKPASRGNHSTAADIALLRTRPDIRNRVFGAVAVPFVLYAVVMVIIGAAGRQYLIWGWIPAVSAGVLAGLILDAAHRHRARADDSG